MKKMKKTIQPNKTLTIKVLHLKMISVFWFILNDPGTNLRNYILSYSETASNMRKKCLTLTSKSSNHCLREQMHLFTAIMYNKQSSVMESSPYISILWFMDILWILCLFCCSSKIKVSLPTLTLTLVSAGGPSAPLARDFFRFSLTSVSLSSSSTLSSSFCLHNVSNSANRSSLPWATNTHIIYANKRH